MKTTAIVATHGSHFYLKYCLRFLRGNQIGYAIVDHSRNDHVETIVNQAEFRTGLACVRKLPSTHVFDLTAQLELKQEIAGELDSDWVIHLDADEVMHTYRDEETLLEGIARLDGEGFNVINFDEFVFLPIDTPFDAEERGFQRLGAYYFFEPEKVRLMRAWKRSAGLSFLDGGHRLCGENIRLANESLALRHYIFVDQSHAYRKYTERRFARRDLTKGWHRNRIGYRRSDFEFPASSTLERLEDPGSRSLSRDNPRKTHYWEWSKGD